VPALLYVFSVLFGLTIGSFLNVVVYRLPRHESLVRPGSHCPSCGSTIHWYDNIPLVSWLFLRGRCRACRGRISVRYLLVEGLAGLSFGLAMWRFGVSWELALAFVFVSVLIVVALIDYDHMLIPSVVTLPAAAVGLGGSIALRPEGWWVHLAAAGGGALFCLLLAVFWPGGGMGGGDVTMALATGAFLGASTIVAFFLAFLVGTLVALYLLVVLKRSRKTRVPFGPFLALGSYVALFAGESLLATYLDLW
jgi:leader peptidase (prepilin peptidase)/N-methyltransferase